MNNDLISRSALLIRLQGVLAMVEEEPNQTYANAIRHTMIDVKLSPAVDAEVVRCKDCDFFKWGDYCTQDKMEHSKCRPDDFCSFGVRKMDAEVQDGTK